MEDGDEFHDDNDFYDPYDFYDDDDNNYNHDVSNVEDLFDVQLDNNNIIHSIQDNTNQQTSSQNSLYHLLEENNSSNNWLEEFLLDENEPISVQPDLNIHIPSQDWLTDFVLEQPSTSGLNVNLVTSPPKKRRCQ